MGYILVDYISYTFTGYIIRFKQIIKRIILLNNYKK